MSNAQCPEIEDDLDLEGAMLLIDDTQEEPLTNPPVLPAKTVRFPDIGDDDIEKLQRASKSDRTHKATRWGLNIIQGLSNLCFIFFNSLKNLL